MRSQQVTHVPFHPVSLKKELQYALSLPQFPELILKLSNVPQANAKWHTDIGTSSISSTDVLLLLNVLWVDFLNLITPVHPPGWVVSALPVVNTLQQSYVLHIAIMLLNHLISSHTYVSSSSWKQNNSLSVSYTSFLPVWLCNVAASRDLYSNNIQCSVPCSWNDKMKINKVVRITECLSSAQGSYCSSWSFINHFCPNVY